MPGWLKAGLIGALILVVINLIGLIPVAFLVCLTLPMTLGTYILAGVLASAWMPQVRTAGSGAGQGALAGLVAAVGGGLSGMLIGVVRAATGSMEAAISQLSPEMLQLMRQSGVEPELFFGAGGVTVAAFICCSVGIFFAVALGAFGGAIYAIAKPLD